MDGKKLKGYLAMKGLKIGAAADILGVSRQTMTTWLKTASFSDSQRELMIEKLGLDDDFFVAELASEGEDFKERYYTSLEEKERLYKQLLEEKEENKKLIQEIEKLKQTAGVRRPAHK